MCVGAVEIPSITTQSTAATGMHMGFDIAFVAFFKRRPPKTLASPDYAKIVSQFLCTAPPPPRIFLGLESVH